VPPANDLQRTTFETPSDLEVLITREFDAPRTLLFEVWTSPQHLPRWMLGPEGWTMPICEVDLRPGGAYRFVWRKPHGAEMTITGTYRDIHPPERLVFTESWGKEWPETVNHLVFTETGGKTTVTQTIRYPSKAARDAAMKTGMRDGTVRGYARLDEYLLELGR
jgi:uncharacterized protein YndB with AHSA1/START domain